MIEGPYWEARNWSADAGEGSIHDDETAASLGFRGGTVAGDVHMNQFPPVMLQVFGERWFEHGNLSLMFRNATVDRERVRVRAEALKDGESQVAVGMERDDGLLVCEGTAAVGNLSHSALQTRDLRPCDPGELRILNRLEPGMSLGEYDVFVSAEKQFERFDNNLISDPLDWFREPSPWGGVLGAPCTVVQYLWGCPMAVLGPLAGESVGLFGAIEIGFDEGPFLIDRNYHIESHIVCVGQSPQTEYVWYDSTGWDEKRRRVVTLRMMSRVMKSSSPAYTQTDAQSGAQTEA